MFWPWANMVNFYFLPFKYQLLFNNIMVYLWTNFLNWKAHADDDK